MDHKSIAKTYLRTWFVLDVVSSFPYSLVEEEAIGFLQLLKVRQHTQQTSCLCLLQVMHT
jgi:hypothetical protein